MAYDWSDYKRLLVYHFLMACVTSALFATGYTFSKGSEGTTNVPYFMPAMVLCAINVGSFILVVRKMWKAKQGKQANTLHYMFLYIGTMWCFIGVVMCASAGFCVGDAVCYYTKNIGINRGIAIGIAVIHAFNFFWLIFLMKYATTLPEGAMGFMHHKKRGAHKVMPIPGGRNLLYPPDKNNTSRQGSGDNNIGQAMLRIELTRKNLNEKRQIGNLPPVRAPFPQKKMPSLSSSSSSSSDDRPPPPPPSGVPPPRARRTMSQIEHQPIRRTHSSIDSAMHKKNRVDLKIGFIKRKDNKDDGSSKHINKTPNGGNDNAPPQAPPSYDAALSSAYNLEPEARRSSGLDKNPYFIPVQHESDHSDINARPDNMYTGTAYPSSDVVVMHPTPLKRQSNLTSHVFSDTQ